ncbi:MAG: alpha-ribazole phosphatase family protein [Candidatus Pelagadaptatus aseana]|uniref:histidine phosphatase family protein n=1 Tax=Candidatus Pelagadaptatus aseana TaxID=3120508 RepID=UPI0039B1E4FD
MSGLRAKQTVTTIDLLRHGECEGGEIWRGHVDVALSHKGWQSMRRSVASLDDKQWDRIVSSPLQRCAEFAREVAEGNSIELSLRQSFKEVNFGDWDGRPSKEVWREQKQQVLEFFKDPQNFAPPNGESLAQLRERLIPAWQQLVEECKGEHVLLVQHGGTIRVLLGWLLNMPLEAVVRLDVPYASISRIRVFHSDDGTEPFPSLAFFNHGCDISPVVGDTDG